MDSIDKAVEWLRLNQLPYYRVEFAGKTGFRSPENEETGKEVDTERSIEFFRQNMDMYGSGSYTLIARRTIKGTNGEQRFLFSKAGQATSSPTISGLDEGRVSQIVNAQLEAARAEHKREIEALQHKWELEQLKKELKELKKGGNSIGGIDRLGEVLGQVERVLTLSRATPGAAGRAAMRPAVSGPVVSHRATDPEPQPEAINGVDGELNADEGSIVTSIERLHSALGDDIITGLAGLAELAESNPAQVKMYLQMMQNNV